MGCERGMLNRAFPAGSFKPWFSEDCGGNIQKNN